MKKRRDMRTFLKERYRQTMPAVLEDMWQRLVAGKVPKEHLAEGIRWGIAECLKQNLPELGKDRMEFDIVAVPVIHEVVNEFLKTKAGT